MIQARSPKRPVDDDHDDRQDTGEFVVLDPLKRVGKVRIDIDWYPGLREAFEHHTWTSAAVGGSSAPADAVLERRAVRVDHADPLVGDTGGAEAA